MKGLFLKQIRRKRAATLLFLVSILLIATALPISITSIQQSQKQVETDITYYARGSYDLLVRPKGVKHPLEDKLGIVPENYIGFGSGGISVAQWEEIKNREDIEIAAPVASLGYFSGMKTTLALFPPEHDYNRYLFQFYTSDGKNEYAFGPEYACIILKDEYSEFGADFLFSHEELLNHCTDKVAMFPMPPTYHLLVGIDPVEEEKLTGISFSSINPDSPNMGWGRMYASELPNATAIPIISVLDSRPTLTAKFSIDELVLTQENIEEFRERIGLSSDDNNHSIRKTFVSQYIENEDEYFKLLDSLKEIKEKSHEQYEVNLSSFINPFFQSDSGVYINKEGEVSAITQDQFAMNIGYFFEMGLTHSMKYYRAGYVKYEEDSGQLKVKMIDEQDGVPIYREIEQVGEILRNVENEEDIKFVLDPVDKVEIGEKAEQLASSPLGIYQFAPVRYIGDGEENAIQLQPTVTPGSFVSAPAEGLTNIQSAELIKGDKPIDAIRVKVAGISGYTKEAAEKIEQVAEDIRKMGLDVTVVAGASPQKLKVEVEGVGLVEESWTTLGAAGTIVREWNVTNVFLSVMFVLVALTYILNRMLYWEVNNKSDIVLMHQLGWKEKHILHLSRQEVLFLVLVGSILSVPILTAFTLSNMSGTQLFINYGISVLVLILFIYLFVTLKVRKVFKDKPVSQKMRTGKGKSLVWKNLVYFRKHILPSFIQITMLALLSSFVYISLSTTAELTGITLLGEYINLQINPYTMTILIITYSITVFTLIESLLSLMKSREAEITTFRQLGWKFTHIYRLYMKEVVVWSGVATILGSGTSAVLFNSLYPLTTKAASVIVVSMVSLYVLVLLVSGIILFYQLKRRLGTSKIKDQKEISAVDVTM